MLQRFSILHPITEKVAKTTEFKGKNIVITGGSSGIGAALALEFAKLGANLLLIARNEERLNSVSLQCKQYGVKCDYLIADFSKPTAADEIKTAFLGVMPQIDVLVNNAGISQRATGFETTPETARAIMEVNYFGPVFLTQSLQPYFNKQQSAIVVISSVVGLFGFPLRTSYSASKHALHGYFGSLRLETKDNPSVLIVCPGRINTPISVSAVTGDGKQHGQIDAGQANGIPADVCAKKIIGGLKSGKKLMLVAKGERLLYFFSKYMPFLYYYISKKISAV